MIQIAKRILPMLLLLGFWTNITHAQIAIDLSVDVTESEGIYTYVYTLENTNFSFQGVNTFLLSTGKAAVVTDINGPENWVAEYAAETTGDGFLQASFIAGVSADGERCGVTDEFDIAPGSSGIFTIESTWAPEPQDYSIGRTISDAQFPCFFDGSDLVGVIASPSIPPKPPEFAPCDFDKDGDCDSKDINDLALTISLGENEDKYELTGDELVNLEDLDEFLVQVERINGDADLNGKVEFADFLTLSGTFGQEERDWTDGDFDADGKVAFADFLILSGNFGQGEVAAAAVPEPNSFLLVGLAMIGLGTVRGRRRSN